MMGKILCCSTHWTYSKQFCYVQTQSHTFSNQALQLHLQNRGLWSVKPLLVTENWQQTWTLYGKL